MAEQEKEEKKLLHRVLIGELKEERELLKSTVMERLEKLKSTTRLVTSALAKCKLSAKEGENHVAEVVEEVQEILAQGIIIGPDKINEVVDEISTMLQDLVKSLGIPREDEVKTTGPVPKIGSVGSDDEKGDDGTPKGDVELGKEE